MHCFAYLTSITLPCAHRLSDATNLSFLSTLYLTQIRKKCKEKSNHLWSPFKKVFLLMGIAKNYIMYWGGYVYYSTTAPKFCQFQF